MRTRLREAAVPATMPPVALVRVAALAPVVAFLRRTGARLGPLLARANLPASLFDSPEGLVPLHLASRFMEDAARAEGIESLGLLAGRETRIDALGFFGRVVRRSPTLDDAIGVAIRTMPAFSSGSRWRLAQDADGMRLSHEFVPEPAYGYGQADGYALTVMVNLLRLTAGPRWRPQDVRLELRQARPARDIEIVSGAKVGFGRDQTAVVFPSSFLRRSMPNGGAVTPASDGETAAWLASAPAADFAGSIEQVVATLSSAGNPGIRRTADAIGMSVRALQRRLAEVGLSYESLIARGRFATARHLLEGTDARVLDIALDLGYSDHAHFTRAFRRWTGVSPREFRRLHRRPSHVAAPPRVPLPADSRAGTEWQVDFGARSILVGGPAARHDQPRL